MTPGGRHLTAAELEAGLDAIRQAPDDAGVVELIVRRPRIGEREILQEAEFDLEEGLVGDSWVKRGSALTPDKRRHPGMQLTIMNARVVALVAQDKNRWSLAGDQLFIDMDLSAANVPAGARLAIGTAVIEVTDVPHTGCGKFVERFGLDAMRFVNSPIGRELNLRGVNARVVTPGIVRVGDRAMKRAAPAPAGIQPP